MGDEMDLYTLLADRYDGLMDHFDYGGWADFFAALTEGCAVKTVLDLGCGTGRLTALLACRGYETIGVDASADMLAVAYGRELPDDAVRPLWLMQDMTALDLYGTVDATVCSLDGLNHLPDLAALKRALARVLLFLEPGGVFVFDMLTPDHFAAVDGQMFRSVDDDGEVTWRCRCEDGRCVYDFDVDGTGCRSVELIVPVDAMVALLGEVGFVDVEVFGDRALRPPVAGEARVFVKATK